MQFEQDPRPFDWKCASIPEGHELNTTTVPSDVMNRSSPHL